ncbi:unnamed protein product [Closterium sp. NIES-54]
MAVAWGRDLDWKVAPLVRREKSNDELPAMLATTATLSLKSQAGLSQLSNSENLASRRQWSAAAALAPVAGNAAAQIAACPALLAQPRRDCGSSPSSERGAAVSSLRTTPRVFFATPPVAAAAAAAATPAAAAASSQPIFRVPELTAASGPFATSRSCGRMPLLQSHPASSLDGFAKLRNVDGTCGGSLVVPRESCGVTATAQQQFSHVIGQQQFSQEFPRARVQDTAPRLVTNGHERDCTKGDLLRKRTFTRSITAGTVNVSSSVIPELEDYGFKYECLPKRARSTPTARRAVAMNFPAPFPDADVAEVAPEDEVSLQMQLYLLRRRQRQQLRLLMEARQAEQQQVQFSAELAMMENEMMLTQQAQLQQQLEQQQQSFQYAQQQPLGCAQQLGCPQLLRGEEQLRGQEQLQQHLTLEEMQQELLKQQLQEQQQLRRRQQLQEQQQQRQETVEEEITRMFLQRQQLPYTQQLTCQAAQQQQQQHGQQAMTSTIPARPISNAQAALEAAILPISASGAGPGPLAWPEPGHQTAAARFVQAQEQGTVLGSAAAGEAGKKRIGKPSGGLQKGCSAKKASDNNPAAMLEALFEKSFKERSASNMTGQGMASGASFESDARMKATALPADMLVAAQGADQACRFKLENEACSLSDPFLLQAGQGPVQKSDLPYGQLTPAEIINGAPFSGVPNGVPCASTQLETFRYLSAALGACEPLDPALYMCQNLDDPNLDMPLQELEAVESLLGVTPYPAGQPGQPGQPGQSSQIFSPIVSALDSAGRSASASAFPEAAGAADAFPATSSAAGAAAAVSAATSAASGASLSAASTPSTVMPELQQLHGLYSIPQSCFAGDGSGVSALLTHPASVFPSPVIPI